MAEPEPRYPFPKIDASRYVRIVCVGSKGTGKSHAARLLFDNWDWCDRLVIDVNGDITPGEGWVTVHGEPPKKLPAREDKHRPVTVRYVPDPRSPTFRDDMDRALGAAMFPRERPVMVWVDEAGIVHDVHRIGPNAQALNHQQRHFHVYEIDCMPRPKVIDRELLHQADYILVFDATSRDDVDALAYGMGKRRPELEEALHEARARHWFVMFDREAKNDDEDGDDPYAGLFVCPPLPKEWARS